MSGVFIVLEGPDGSGTTTLSRLLAQKLESEGRSVLLTREPTDGKHGQRIRAILHGKGELPPEEIQQLFSADRREHVEKGILPALKKGRTVVCDRYIPSTLVYGEVSGVNRELIEAWNEGFPHPTLTVIALPSFAVCLKRVQGRKVQDVFEQESFMKRVYDGYTRYVKEHPEVLVVDTSRQPEENLREIMRHVDLLP